MKFTVAELKKFVKRRTANTGLVLSKSAPYWVNSDQIEYMAAAVADVVEMNNIPEKQAKSLNNWIDGLKETYLR